LWHGFAWLKGGPRYGIDFAGGVVIQAQFDAPTKLDDLKKTLEGTGLPGLVVQQMGQEKDNDFLIRTSISEGGSESVQKVVTTAISTEMGGVVPNYKRIEMVGPKVGEDLRQGSGGHVTSPSCSSQSIFPGALNTAGWLQASWRLGSSAAYGLSSIFTRRKCGWCWGAHHHPGALLSAQAQLCARGHRGPHPRRTGHGGSVLDHEQGIRPDHHRRAFDPHRLLAQRHHRRVRPHPRDTRPEDRRAAFGHH
jgi:hypothetical protein